MSNYFGKEAVSLLDELIACGIYPLVYAYVHGAEKFSFLKSKCNAGTHAFLATRKGDIRENPVHDVTELYAGDIFYITCIDKEEKLAPFYEKYTRQYHRVFQKELYTNEQWLEIMPKVATKANTVDELKHSATKVIGSNDDDGVAKWLNEIFKDYFSG